MSNTRRVAAVLILVVAVAAVLILKQRGREAPPEPAPAASLPRLVDLGAGKCIPCKLMAPILEELEKDYAGTFTVEFIDVWKDPKAGEAYGIRMIPTQIFYDASGKELFRHEGFFGKEEILATWRELGVTAEDDED